MICETWGESQVPFNSQNLPVKRVVPVVCRRRFDSDVMSLNEIQMIFFRYIEGRRSIHSDSVCVYSFSVLPNFEHCRKKKSRSHRGIQKFLCNAVSSVRREA